MKSGFSLFIISVCSFTLVSIHAPARSSGFVKQVLIANSGKFEYTPPYNDFVTLQSYNPQIEQVYYFNTIFTQSVQSILICGHVAFIAAQDSIVKYNLNTLQRMAAVADSGLNRMAVYNGKLLVSKQYPVSRYFLEVLDTANLGLIARVSGLSGDCGGICAINDTVYVAVNGGWMGTDGKLAIIDPMSWSLQTEVNFGTVAIGIWDLYVHNGSIFSVNKSPYGVIDAGSVTAFNPLNRGFTNVLIPARVAAGSGIKDDLLYLGINYGIGSFNMNTLAMVNPQIVRDPGSSVFNYILSSAVDTSDNRIYTNIGDYATPGYCLVTSLNGDSLTSFPTGISSDAVAVDARAYPVGITDNSAMDRSVRLYPNPVHDKLRVSLSSNVTVTSVKIIDVSGRVLINLKGGTISGSDFEVEVSSLNPGLYYLAIETSGARIVRSFAVAAP